MGQMKWPLTTANDDREEFLANPNSLLDEQLRRYEKTPLNRAQWLDQLAFRALEQQQQQQQPQQVKTCIYLVFPTFDTPVLFQEKLYPVPVVLPHPWQTLYDPESEMMRSNDQYTSPCEVLHRRLARAPDRYALTSGKPDAQQRDQLQKIRLYGPTRPLTAHERDLVWRYRDYLMRDGRGLVQFVQSVQWDDPRDVQEAQRLMNKWRHVTIEDVLALFCDPSSKQTLVQRIAVKHLREMASDTDLELYLLQLVQALRWEPDSDETLAPFLIERSAANPVLGSLFHWYLMVECEDPVAGERYAHIAYQFMNAVASSAQGQQARDRLRRQSELISTLSDLARQIRQLKGTRIKKVEKLRHLLAEPHRQLTSFAPIPLPLDPRIQVIGIVAEKASVFKSSLMPLRLTFRTTQSSEYSVIFKVGDDLRQDQLVVQLIMLMDRLWQKENLDLQLTPYRVLATSSEEGMVQFVPSMPLAQILAEHQNSIQAYLRHVHPDAQAPYGIDPTVMDTYIKSCAAYCVITFLLGIGDRHLDNLLMTPHGHLFHVDFGFILGRDPKPFPPPMKLAREMVEAMGGAQSPHYATFKSYCFVAFSVLRKSANLIASLLVLMRDARLPDLQLGTARERATVEKLLERFQLDEHEEEAIRYLESVIQESVGALFPQVIETIHKWAQYWRS